MDALSLKVDNLYVNFHFRNILFMKFNEKFVKQDRALGELGHPSGPTVNLDRVSHIITELQEDGKNLIGKAKIIDTPNGKIVKNLLESGVRLGVSSNFLSI